MLIMGSSSGMAAAKSNSKMAATKHLSKQRNHRGHRVNSKQRNVIASSLVQRRGGQTVRVIALKRKRNIENIE